MKASFFGTIFDIWTLFLLRLKLITKDLTTVFVMICSILVFALVIRSMASSAEALSSIPIGIVDKDRSDSSSKLITDLKKSETFRITSGDEKELKNRMLNDKEYAVFVIENGYEDKLKSGDLNDLITVYYKENNQSAAILSDIVAGEIMYPASFYKSYRYYKKFPQEGQKQTFTDYQDYMERLMKRSDEFGFAFQMVYAAPGKQVRTDATLSNAILYDQLVFGITGMLAAFIAMFLLSQTVKEKETGVDIRLKISRFHSLKRDFAGLCAVMLPEGVISALFTGLMFCKLQIGGIDLWYSAFLLLLFNALVLTAAMQLIGKAVRRMLVYQMLCSALILFAGGIGFYSLVNGIFHGIPGLMIKIIPNSWFIKGLTDIIVYKSGGGCLREGHIILLSMAAALLFLIFCIDMIQDFHKEKEKRA